MKYAVMEFETGLSLGQTTQPNKWINSKTSKFDNGTDALLYYSNTPCGWSEIIQANDDEELERLINEMKNNMLDENYLKENVYDYI